MNEEFEPTSRNRALSIMHDMVGASFELMEAKGKISHDDSFNIDWTGFAWVFPTFNMIANPFEAYLIVNQLMANEIDGVDRSSNFAWVEEKTLADHHGTSVSFINGMIGGFAQPTDSLSALLQKYNAECAASFAEYEGSDIVPSSCEDDEDFSLGVDMGQRMFAILKEAGAFQ